MANNVSTPGKQKISKKDFRRAVLEKMEAALADYKKELGEKQFSSRIKKASKLFSRKIDKIRKKKKNKAGKSSVLEMSDGVLVN